MQVDFLIIGQGISGAWLSYYLQKEGKRFIVIHDNFNNSPSRIAAGIINPVTGRRHVTVWMAENILPFAWHAYNEIGDELGITAISPKNIIDFFLGPQMRQSFIQRIGEDNTYVREYPDANHFDPYFNFDFGCGEIAPGYIVHLEKLLPAWRQRLKKENFLLEEHFDSRYLKVSATKIEYKDIVADKIIFCDGNSSASSPFFKNLPFAPNKGEALLVEIPGLPDDRIYKKGMMLAPMAAPDLWWIGSNYAWEFSDANPTVEFRKAAEQALGNWLKIPFKVADHLCGIRPATLERRPFAGLHPHYPAIGILNGMGAKGCSLAPFFAKQLSGHLCRGEAIHPEAGINRFQKILGR